MGHKIGIGIITCNRENLFHRSFSSIPDVDEIVAVNDGLPYPEHAYGTKRFELVQHKRNRGVGISKNDAFRFLLGKGCDHIFISEDDVQILDPGVIDEYIRTAEVSGIGHLNFAYHGPLNKTPEGGPNPKKIVEYPGEIRIALHGHLPGAFSYYSAHILNEVGLIDEWFKNAYDHLDHTYQIIKAGYHPSFGWFADIADSFRYIKDLDADLSQSVIRKSRYFFKLRYRAYALYFMAKHGAIPERLPIATKEQLERELETLRRDYGSR
jgi:glycosyltransferase involved in cell wall biosynthesis